MAGRSELPYFLVRSPTVSFDMMISFRCEAAIDFISFVMEVGDRNTGEMVPSPEV